ncbi:DUF742 domain-containing protein [Pseudonocardia sichuanensis]
MDAEDDPGPALGLTGARFGGVPRQRRSAREPAGEPGADDVAEQEDAAPPAVAAPPVAGAPGVGTTGARFGGASWWRRAAPVEPAPEPSSRPSPAAEPSAGGAAGAAAGMPGPVPEEEPDASAPSFVRPYVLTGGRTRSSVELSIETLVSAAPRPPAARLSGEQEVVLGLCREPRSVAELAVGAGVPLGVARVLVGDLAAAGAVAVHRTAGPDGPDLALMERVLSGLRKL